MVCNRGGGKIKAVILAAGRGTRLEPVTSELSKCMLPIAGKPVLEHIVNAVKGAGIKDVLLVVSYKKERIEEHFGDGKKLGVNISYLVQEGMLGTAHAVGLASEVGEDFLVLNGDTIVSAGDIKAIIEAHYGAAATLGLRRVEDPKHYGVVELEGGRVKGIYEKPERFISDLVNVGIYVFSPKIFGAIKGTKKSKRGEYEITASIEKLIEDGEEVRGLEIKGRWSDIGNPWNYLDSNQEVLKGLKKGIKGKVEQNVTVSGNLHLGKGSVVRSGTYIEGPVYIGENTTVGPNAYIRSFTSIGDNCKIGNAVELKNSIIMGDSNVPHLSYVGDSIIGRHCNFGAGTLVGNLRLDEKSVKMIIKEEVMDTGRRKLGCVVGDNVKTGLNVMINSGRKIGSNSMIGPGIIVYTDIPPNSFILKRQDVITKGKDEGKKRGN